MVKRELIQQFPEIGMIIYTGTHAFFLSYLKTLYHNIMISIENIHSQCEIHFWDS